jgi:hypothetical protein
LDWICDDLSDDGNGPTVRVRKVRYDAPQKQGGGGAWRAYVHINGKGLAWDPARSTELSMQYRLLTAEEFAFYRDLGRQACISHKTGPSFIKKRRLLDVGAVSSAAALRCLEDAARVAGGQAVAAGALPQAIADGGEASALPLGDGAGGDGDDDDDAEAPCFAVVPAAAAEEMQLSTIEANDIVIKTSIIALEAGCAYATA